MEMQPVHETDWDNLIVLDACRFEEFKEEYKNYPKLKEGKLEKKKSRGSWTPGWLAKTFTEPMEDVVYFSANAFINDRNKSPDELKKHVGIDWNPTKHFKKVIEVWLTNWSEEKKTVLPSSMNKAVINSRYKECRKIIHYIQPHLPYLNSNVKMKERRIRKKVRGSIENTNASSFKLNLLRKILPLLRPFYSRIDKKYRWRVLSFLGIDLTLFPSLVAKGKIEKLRTLYKENLDIVLKEVEELVESLNGKIIITADHGEVFGEQGKYKHFPNSNSPLLREVPWLVIDKGKKKVKGHNEVKRKIQKLKEKGKV